jgi:hypothetical protein
MSRKFQDADLLLWEAFPSGGSFGFDEDVKIIFHCLSDPQRRPRFVETSANSADAERRVERADDDALLALLGRSEPLP